MPILPDQFDSTPVLDLLLECEKGLIGFDQRLVASLLARREETLAALAGFTADDRDDALLDMREQAFDLYRHLRAPEALPFFIDLLKQRGETIPDELVEAFSDLGAAAVDPLLALHEVSVDDDRPDLVFLLSTLGVDDPRITALIAAAIQADPYEGAICAGLSADPALRPAVLAALDNAGADSEEHKILAECLEQIEAGRPPHELSGYDITADYPETALPLFDQMDPAAALAFFDCEDREYRARAAMGFTDDDYPDEIRDRLVALARNDADSLVRGAALRALGERIAEPEVRALLIQALETRQDQHDEWMGALIGLAGATSEPEVHTALLEAYAREDSRAGALQTMWRSLDARYKKYFGPNLKHADPDIRRQAVQGVGAFPITELAFDLVPLFKDDELRDEALFSYAMAIEHQTTPKTVNKLFDRIAEKAGGLDEDEEDTVATALDRRLEREGFEAVYFPDEDHDHPHEAEPPQEPVRVDKVGRNDPCPCGSGKKYKKCCGAA